MRISLRLQSLHLSLKFPYSLIKRLLQTHLIQQVWLFRRVGEPAPASQNFFLFSRPPARFASSLSSVREKRKHPNKAGFGSPSSQSLRPYVLVSALRLRASSLRTYKMLIPLTTQSSSKYTGKGSPLRGLGAVCTQSSPHIFICSRYAVPYVCQSSL